MPKGAKKTYYLGSSFHLCSCGYAIENACKKLIEMKRKLHRKICSKWKQDNVESIDIGRVNLSMGQTQHNVNTEAYCLKQIQ
jgi:hypothetical protein